jgi:hypothetical protein
MERAPRRFGASSSGATPRWIRGIRSIPSKRSSSACSTRWGLTHFGRFTLTGTAVWAVREDGKLLHNWVERSSWELFQRLNETPSPGS